MWSTEGIREVRATVARSPAVCGPPPWWLRFIDGAVELYEKDTFWRPHPDPVARDRLVSCGAAAATLELALRSLDLRVDLRLLPDEDRPQLLARAGISGKHAPTARERVLGAAIARRHSYRRPFGPAAVDPQLVDRLTGQRDLDGSGVPHTQVLRIRGEHDTLALARLLSYAATAIRADSAYQRELAAWTGDVSGGVAPVRPELDTLPWGLIRSTTHVPDVPTLAQRLRAETTLLVLSADDARIDHLRAGLVTQHLWLSAVAAGLVASVHTQALQLPEVRAGLIEQLELAGYPHLLMRLGHHAPVTPTAPSRTEERMTEVR